LKGLVHIYTGDGKGKTTAALGLGMRACGREFKVLMVQFLKGSFTGEINTIKMLEPYFTLYRGEEVKKFTWSMNEKELEAAKIAQNAILKYAVEQANSGGYDLLILDEIMAAITIGLVSLQNVVDFAKNKPEELELVMTGRNVPEELIELADYVSEIKAVKHPMEKGIAARHGIED
jgi:cob(I)alamin adenosyltransferase